MSMPPDSANQENWRNVNGVLRPVEEWRRHLVALHRCCRENFLWISSFVVGFSFLFGAINLFGFARFIGRPDIFMASFEYGPGLVSLTLSFLPVYIFIFFFYFVFSYVFVSKLMELRTDKASLKLIGFWLLGVVASCALFVSLVIMCLWYEWPWRWIFIGLVVFCVVIFYFVDWCRERSGKKKIRFYFLIFNFIFHAVFFVLANVFLWVCSVGLILGLLSGKNS